MKLEEKRKEIEELCQNLNESIYITIMQKFPENQNYVCIDAHPVRENYNIDIEEEYNELIAILKANQIQPELYTWQEIDRVRKKWIEERHTIKEHTSVFDFLKNNIKPYKK